MPTDISTSILETIKKLIGIDKDYGVFDLDLIVAINSSFMILNQLGIGPKDPFSIAGPESTWENFSQDIGKIELVKSYIYLRARLLFDPPATGVLHEAIERQILEFEWRLMIQAEQILGSDSENGGGSTPNDDGSIDHSTLINRDLPDQHPIAAISGLSAKFESIPSPIKKADLDKILI